MILAAVVLKLQALDSGRLPLSHGRLLHAAFLSAIRLKDVKLSAALHDAVSKSFSLGLLQLKHRLQKQVYCVEKGDLVAWRICAMGSCAKNILELLQPGLRLQVGPVSFAIAGIDDTSQNLQAGTTTTEYLQEQCALLPAMQRLTLHFITPTVFRYFEYDYPWPKADLVFGSLAERWNQLSGEAYFSVDKIKQIAADYLIPDKWDGCTKRVNLSPAHGVTGFIGSFSYRLSLLPTEYRALFILLAEFAVFAGVGRLTGQGLGQVCVKYE